MSISTTLPIPTRRERTIADRQRLRQFLIESESDPSVVGVDAMFYKATRAYREAGRYRDARAVLMLQIGLHCRTRFVYETGKEEAGGSDATEYSRRLRGLGILSRSVFRQFRDMVDAAGPYTDGYVEQLADVAVRVAKETRLPRMRRT